MIVPRKSATTILNEMMTTLGATTGITNFKAGSVARTLLEVVRKQLDDIYATLDSHLLQSFVSSASGVYLDYMGALVGCTRYAGENDAAYRYRITLQHLSMAKANETSIRLACLTVDGVRDIELIQGLYGPGSFGAYVVTDEVVPPASVLAAVQAQLDATKAFGVYARALRPDLAEIVLQYRILTSDGIQLPVSTLQPAVRAALDEVGMGGRVDLAKLIKIPYNVGANVLESRVTSLTVKGEELAGRQYIQLATYERPRLIQVTIV